VAVATFWGVISLLGNILVATFASTSAFLGALVFLVLQNLDRTARGVSWIYAGLAWFGMRFERGAIGNQIRGELGEATKKVNSEGGVAILPHGVKVKWVKPKDVERDSFIEEGNVVVILEHHKNGARNLARATSLYVSGGLIPSSRAYVDPHLMKAVDLAIARKLLALEGRMDAVEVLTHELLAPTIKNDPSVEQYLAGIEQMDQQGTFTRVLMREYAGIWSKLYLQPPSQAIFTETVRFADIMKTMATRLPHSTNILELQGAAISTHIIPVARDELVGVDITPHLDAAHICHANTIETVYIVARGKVNNAMAEVVVQGIEADGLYILEKASSFRGQMGAKRLPFYIAGMRLKES